MCSKLDLTTILTDSLEEAYSGALCGLNVSGEISTHSTGSISKKEHHKQFYIYSITKTFTATAVLFLAERNKELLDKSFSSFFPHTKIPSSITIRQLLNHSGGLSDYGSKEYQEAVHSHPHQPWNYEHLMEIGLQNTPLFEPGDGWAYSNPGYALLKEVIEKISGQDYYSFLNEIIFKPINLLNTRPFLKPDYECQLLQSEDPYIKGDFRKQYSPHWIATGCLISTVSDITRFYHALFSGDILNSESLQQMKMTVEVPIPAPTPSVYSYGLGLMHIKNDPLGAAYGHGGDGPGYATYARHYPAIGNSTFSLSLVLTKNNRIPTRPSITTLINLANCITHAFIKNKKKG